MTEAMIDIETLDTANSAVIFQIGAVIFEGPKVTAEFCLDVAVQDQIDTGRTINSSTLGFWLNPEISGVAHKALTSKYAMSKGAALHQLRNFLAQCKLDAVWAKGSFDFNLLENACEQYGVEVPWTFRQPRDLRTMMKECGVPKHDNISHNALDDCLNQHRQLMDCRGLVFPIGTDEGDHIKATADRKASLKLQESELECSTPSVAEIAKINEINGLEPPRTCSEERPCVNCFSDQGDCTGPVSKLVPNDAAEPGDI